jgi:hypothetical protein
MKQYTTVQRPLPTGRYINLQRLHNGHTINQPDTTLRSLNLHQDMPFNCLLLHLPLYTRVICSQ